MECFVSFTDDLLQKAVQQSATVADLVKNLSAVDPPAGLQLKALLTALNQ